MKASNLTYILQSDIERISADRLERFKSRQNEELTPAFLDDTTVMHTRDFIITGEHIAVKNSGGLFFGQLIKLRKFDPKFKKNPAFKYWSYYFDLNEKVEYLLSPLYQILDQGWFIETPSKKWFRKEDYLTTLNSRHIDFDYCLLPEAMLNNLHFNEARTQ